MKSSQIFSVLLFFIIWGFFFLFVQGEVPRSTKQEHLHAVTRISKPYSSGHLAVNSSKRGSSKSSPQVFNVVCFGAVGHGITDDSEAFKKAWSAACQAKKPALLLVPSKRSLMIQAEIFTGPCQSRLIIQVVLASL